MSNIIYPCLWFNGNGNDAAALYCQAFFNTKITTNSPMVIELECEGQKIMCLNGGPMFKPNSSISFFITCETMEEIDKAWAILGAEGSILMQLDKYPWSQKYGWVQDKFGISWQLSYGKIQELGQKITPTLMFNQQVAGRAAEAITFYTDVFSNSSVIGVLKYQAGEEDVEGYVKHAQFKLGQNVMMAMDSSDTHSFMFSEGISLVVPCNSQQKIDYYWDRLTADGGKESKCGWLKDKFGVSWQIIPSILGTLMQTPEKAQRVMQAFLKMSKFDIDTIVNA